MTAKTKGHAGATAQPMSPELKAQREHSTTQDLLVNLMLRMAAMERENASLKTRIRRIERRFEDAYDWSLEVPREREGA